MNILSITHQYPPYHQGGRAKHIQSLFQALGDKGVKIDVITLGKGASRQEDNITVHLIEPVFQVDALNKFYFISKANERAKKLKQDKKIDIVLSHSTDGALVSKDEIPFVVKLHGFRASWMHLHKKPTRRVYYELERWLEKRVLKKADEVIAVSEMVKRDVKNFYGVQSVVHENAISDLFRGRMTTDKSFEDKKNLLMVGSFVRRKGCHLIPSILEKMSEERNDVKLIHVGKISDGDLYHEVKRKLGSKGLSKYFRAHGRVDRKELCRFYEGSRLLIHPAVYDPYPKAPMEALALGTHVVVSTGTGGYEELKKRTGGIHISELQNFPDKVVEAYRSALEEKPDVYALKSWDEVASETLNFFEKIAYK